jgi:DNA repair photolyase
MHDEASPIRGRGAADNPANRFERLHYENDPDADPSDRPAPTTQFFKDLSRSIIAHNDSPDVGFEYSINPYRGCEHGCVYCYARPTHEYLGFSAGLDFESKIMVKEDAPELLRRELTSPRWQPRTLAVSGVTDPYQPVERRLQLTRRCLEVLAEFRNPVGIVTKNHLVTRDLDILAGLAEHQAAAVFLSVTTLDGNLARHLEPRATQPQGRLAAIEAAAKAGVSVGVLVAPVIPGLTDHEMPAILAAAAAAGARYAGYILLRLPLGVGPLFEQWLTQHYPEKKDKVLGRIRDTRGGKLNDPRFGSRMRGKGAFADLIKDVFTVACRKSGITGRGPNLSTAAFRRPKGNQLLLFEE